MGATHIPKLGSNDEMDAQTPTKCSQPKMLTKKRIAGMNQVRTIITIT